MQTPLEVIHDKIKSAEQEQIRVQVICHNSREAWEVSAVKVDVDRFYVQREDIPFEANVSDKIIAAVDQVIEDIRTDNYLWKDANGQMPKSDETPAPR